MVKQPSDTETPTPDIDHYTLQWLSNPIPRNEKNKFDFHFERLKKS